MLKFIAKLLLAAVAVAPLVGHAEGSPIKLGYAKCAQCTPIALTPENAIGVKIDAIGFNTGNDVLTALVSKSIDVAQVTYLHYAMALDRGFDVVAISGQISGGQQVLIGNDVPVAANDWDSLKKLIAQYKAQGKVFRIGASRGNASDLEMRGSFATHGIDVNKDVEFVNIQNPADDTQALRRGEVQLISTVEPYATQILQLHAAKFFAFPYDQAAGNLANLIVTRSDVIASDPKGVQATVNAIIKVDHMVGANKTLWVDTIGKVAGLDKTIAAGAVENLTPDDKMYRGAAVAIGQMMHNLKYINSDVSSSIKSHMDYQFLEVATGKSKTELGY
ncbi:ABC transporter substrate-binding protein [Paraburkholderia sp. RL17-337-BIB-A]|uniref:ABC transporter substrate-binding protein n=1 Tax=Paraburkholderia sp. RL17-337-BIB-A TaxID=3031636 RepID=UPI0038B79353